MANAKSSIEWCDATWSPVTGCSHVSDGCRFCYAETLTRRFAETWGVPDLPWTAGNAAANVILHPERLDQPLRWRRPRLVFVNSMSDLFHEQIDDWFITAVFGAMGACRALGRGHTFQVLTKRPGRMRDYLSDPANRERIAYAVADHCEDGDSAWDMVMLGDWPLPNCWLGVSIESRRHVDRADILRSTPAAHRFISAEPLLGPLVPDGGTGGGDDGDAGPSWRNWRDGAHDAFGRPVPGLDLDGIDWLIAGGESGAHFDERPDRFLVTAARGGKLKPEAAGWLRDLRDACAAAGTHFMLKQLGGQTPKAGGRELDGQTYDWTPTPAGVATRTPGLAV